MKNYFNFHTLSVLAAVCLTCSHAKAANFSKDQIKEIQGIARDFIINNPEVLVEASQALQQKNHAEMVAKVSASIPKYQKELFTSKLSPTLGNPKANLFLVQFVDYSCGHCRKMDPVVQELLKNYPNLQVIVKEFPIFGDNSDYVAKVAISSHLQGKYASMHSELMTAERPLDLEKVDKIAVEVGMNSQRMARDIQSDEIAKELTETLELAKNLGVVGTPAFVIAWDVSTKNIQSFFLPGSAPYDSFDKIMKRSKIA